MEFIEAETVILFLRAYHIPLVSTSASDLGTPRFDGRQWGARQGDVGERGLNGRGRPADGPVWPEHWAHSSPPEPFVFSPEAARLRLDNAGFKARRLTDGSMPARFTFTCLVFASDPRFERLAMLVQKQLADVGVDMKLLPLKQDDLEARLRNGDFDAFLFEFFGRSISYAYEFWHTHDDRPRAGSCSIQATGLPTPSSIGTCAGTNARFSRASRLCAPRRRHRPRSRLAGDLRTV